MSKKAFGPKSLEDYYSKEDQLWDWACNYGQGIMGLAPDVVPEECVDFCLSQFARFNIPLPSCIIDVIIRGAGVTMYHVDVEDPYALLSGVSDVNAVWDWCHNAYEVWDGPHNGYEPDPQFLETFAYAPGQAEVVFDHTLSHPALDALPNMIGDYLSGMIRGVSDYSSYIEEPVWKSLNEDHILELRSMCLTPEGTFNETKFLAYFDLAAWAAFAWIAGPPSRAFRMYHHEIMSVAIKYGECILADGLVIAPTHYKKLSRPPQSCYRCGVAGWCVEIVLTMGNASYMCEHCLTEGMPKPKNSPLNCGSKMCMFTECPHNPYHGMGAGGINRSRAEHGQLGAMARGESCLRTEGDIKRLE